MPDLQVLQFQVLNIFFFAIVCDLHKLFLKSNSVCEEFKYLLWWTIRMIYVKMLLLFEQWNLWLWKLALILQDTNSAEVQMK